MYGFLLRHPEVDIQGYHLVGMEPSSTQSGILSYLRIVEIKTRTVTLYLESTQPLMNYPLPPRRIGSLITGQAGCQLWTAASILLLLIPLAAANLETVNLKSNESSRIADEPNTKASSPTDDSTKKTLDSNGIVECVVTLASGRKITGEFIRQNSLIVVVGINGIETTFQKNKVSSIVILPPVKERYKQMRDAIPDDDIDARLTLIEWLRARRAYSLAIKELRSVLDVDPGNHRAKLLYTWLTEYDKLGSRQKKNDTDKENPETPTTTESSKNKTPTSQSGKTHRIPTPSQITPLTPEQINLIRVYEIDLRNPPKLRVPDETLQELILRKPDEFSTDENERKKLFKLPEVEKLKILFSLKARDLYSQVQVLEDPASIKDFKENVYSQRGWLINACASTRCHGGNEAGAFKLINKHPNAPESLYTNFYILDHYTLKDGSHLINYDDPERSPLLQMGMIAKNSLNPHPPIPAGRPGRGYRPIFRTTRDHKYKSAIEWIRSMYQPRPDYGFEAHPYSIDTQQDPSKDSDPSKTAP